MQKRPADQPAFFVDGQVYTTKKGVMWTFLVGEADKTSW